MRKQNHDILLACERAQGLIVRRHFLTGLYLIHNSGILPTIHVCNELDLGILAALLSWRVSLERRKSVFSFPSATGPFFAFFSCLGHAGTGRRGEKAARGSGTVPKVSCFWRQVSRKKLWRAGKTNALLSLQVMKMLILGRLKSNFEGFHSKNMLGGQCY